MSEETMEIWRFKNGSQMASLYYYNGNFFFPVFVVKRDIEMRIRRLCTLFASKNKALILADRSHPDYKTKVQLAVEQGL